MANWVTIYIKIDELAITVEDLYNNLETDLREIVVIHKKHETLKLVVKYFGKEREWVSGTPWKYKVY